MKQADSHKPYSLHLAIRQYARTQGTPPGAALKSELEARITQDSDALLAYDNTGFQPLHTAARYGLEDVMRWLLRAGVDINTRTRDGANPLAIAGYHAPTVKTLKWLLNRGADVQAKDNDGRRPLHYAALRNDTDGLRILLGAGADGGAKDARGHTALWWANSHFRSDNVALLFSQDPAQPVPDELNIKEEHLRHILDNGTPPQALLQFARFLCSCDKYGLSATHEQRRARLRLLLDAGLDPMQTDPQGDTLLHLQCRAGMPAKDMQLILDTCPDIVNLRNRSGATPLYLYVAKHPFPDLSGVSRLLNAGADPSVPLFAGRTPLQALRQRPMSHPDKGRLEKYLLDHGAQAQPMQTHEPSPQTSAASLASAASP